ncbi:uncharacterized protein LOC135805848 isoform X2 [Sycon ciliatum]|uniref:uncharacterized protein LOC135805848 isoform X2 n=1 Tax=Sycon ciliatum TaxID=27933 RepID=UPI0031F6D8FA
MKLYITIVLCGLLAASANAAIKSWKGPDNSYTNTVNWLGGSLPCSADNATFAPVWSPSTVFIQNSININNLILPEDGTLTFADTMNIGLGGQPTFGCRGGSAVFQGQAPGNWDDPTNWNTLDSVTNAVLPTTKIPPADRLPCNTDSVRFPASRPVNVHLNRPVTVNQFVVNNQPLAQAALKTFLSSPSGMGQFHVPSSNAITLGPGCAAGSLCQCGTSTPDIVRTACCLSKTSCPDNSGCRGPVTLQGDCCAVCGGILTITTTYFDQSRFVNAITARVTTMTFKYHIIDASHIQVLVVGNQGFTKVNQLRTAISQGPSTFGLPSNPTMVTSGSIVDTKTVPVPGATTARPPAATTARAPVTPAPGPITTVPEAPTTQEVVPSKCIQIVPVTEDGAEVTGTNGQILTEIRTVVIEPNRNDAQAGDTKTDSTPWVIVGVFGALLVIALIVIIVLVLRGRKQNAPPPVHHGSPVQYVHNPETGASKATTGGRVKLGQNFAQPPEEPNVYEVNSDVTSPMYTQDTAPRMPSRVHSGATNPMYSHDTAPKLPPSRQVQGGASKPIYTHDTAPRVPSRNIRHSRPTGTIQ